jgi:hypothetical protein
MLELLGCEIGVLQGHRRQSDEPVRLCRADLGELLVLQLDDLIGEVRVGLVPGLRLSASMSMPCSSITLMRSGEITSDCNCTFKPISAFASGT